MIKKATWMKIHVAFLCVLTLILIIIIKVLQITTYWNKINIVNAL